MTDKYFELDQQISKEVIAQLIAEGKTSYPVKCEDCDGKGWISYPIHVCGGDERACNVRCPEEERAQCERCDSNGYYEVTIAAKK